jgi:hypothetical protein
MRDEMSHRHFELDSASYNRKKARKSEQGVKANGQQDWRATPEMAHMHRS